MPDSGRQMRTPYRRSTESSNNTDPCGNYEKEDGFHLD